MRHVCLFRAQGVPRRDAVDEVTIVIANPMPDLPADALWASLPSGTFDALTGAMLARRASLLRVPMPTPGSTP